MSRKCARASGWLLGFALALLAASQGGCPVWQDQDTPVQELHQTEPKTKAKYYLYVPSEYSADRAWPMVVTLHGTHGFDGAGAQVKEWKALAEEHGFLVLAPHLSSPQGILPVLRSLRLSALDKDEQRVLAAIAEVKKGYRVEEQGVLLTGFSAAGYPLYYIGLRNPQVFNALVARACNFDLGIVKTIPVTDAVRKLPVLIFFSKTGINPVYSKWNPVAKQSWAALRYLRENGCTKVKIESVTGGHHRRPDVAYTFWKKYLPKRQ